jgi:zinc transporter
MATTAKKFSIALHLDGEGGATELSDEDVDGWQPGSGLLWIDLNLSNKAARRWLRESGKLDSATADILLAGETRPRTLPVDDGMIVVMRGINMNPGAVPDDMVAVRMLLRENLIITSRRRRVLSVSDVKDALLAGKGPRSAGQFLVTLTGALSGRIEAAVDNIDTVLEQLGETVAAGNAETVRTDLGAVRRQAAALRRHLSPQRDALERLARSSTGFLSDSDVFDLREEGDQLTRHIEDLDLARENALVTQEELTNRIAMEQNARMYLLSVVAAIFLPLTFVTGLLGMNVAGLPGTDEPSGFLYSILIMIGLGAALLAYFRWKRWI